MIDLPKAEHDVLMLALSTLCMELRLERYISLASLKMLTAFVRNNCEDRILNDDQAQVAAAIDRILDKLVLKP